MNYLEIFVEELSKEGYSIVKAGVNTLLKNSVDTLLIASNSYINTRFEIRLEYFIHEQEQLTDEAKKDFYENINHTKLSYLFELLEKTRISTYDLHAKILANFYSNLLKNGDLNYHEKTFLSNIDILNDEDLIHFHKIMKNNIDDISESEMEKLKISFPINTYTEYYIFEKLVRAGLMVEYSSSGGMNFATLNEEILKNKFFYIHCFSKEIYLFLDKTLRDKNFI